MAVIRQTYELADLVGGALRSALALPQGVAVADLDDSVCAGYQIHMGYERRFRKEGEVVLSLRERVSGRRIFGLSLAFESASGMPVTCYVGCLQGAAGCGDVIKHLTKAMHGLRPAALLAMIAQHVAIRYGAGRLLGVGDAIQVHRRRRLIYLRRFHQLHFHYDQFWSELGGQRNTEDWFELPLVTPRRLRAELPAHKRAQYARRYQFIDALVLRLQAGLR